MAGPLGRPDLDSAGSSGYGIQGDPRITYKAQIPYGAYWSTPFARWQGALAHLHAIEFGAYVVKRELARRKIPTEVFDHGVLGFTVPQRHCFFGLPWLTGLAGLPRVGGPTLMQACATGVRTILAAVQEIEAGMAQTAFAVTCDRTSNGPHLYYPAPQGPGGTGSSEDWVLGNFGCDPLGRHAMIQTAENVAGKHGFTTAQQHEVVLQRESQYREATSDGAAFLKRFMTLPFEVPAANFKKIVATMAGDDGINHSTPEGLAQLKPVVEGGTVTFGAQTHPADGNAGMVVTTPERAPELASDPKIAVRLHGFGQSRAALAYMPEAPVSAARHALEQAGRSVKQMDAIKTHNPFAVNDLLFAKETGADLAKMNNYGCSLVWGHPQAAMGMRAVIELVEELALRGGGWGLFSGCAAGDTAMAVMLQVGDA